MSRTVRQIAWIAAIPAILALPFLVLLRGERVEGNGFLFDLSMGFGFGALAVAGLQFALTARFRRLSHPFGIDIVYVFHRYMAIGALGLMLAHFGILYFWFEEALGVLNPLEARWELTAARLALLCFAGLVVTSELRKWLKLEYGWWRYLHVALAIVGFGAAIAHVLGVGRFTADLSTRFLWLGVTIGWLAMLLWVRIGKPWNQKRNPWIVVDNIAHHGGVHQLVLRPQGKPLSNHKPGQFAWLTLERSPFGLGEHPFTISSPPEHGPDVTLSIKALGDFTEQAVEVEKGAVAYLDGPYGTFSIDTHPDAKGFILIAGGVGITPMISNLHAMDSRRDTRPAVLFYCNKAWDDAAFRDELAELAGRINLKVVHVLEEPPEDWDGETGRLSADILKRHLPASSRDWPHMLCGPKPLTDAARQDLLKLGVPFGTITNEIFDMV